MACFREAIKLYPKFSAAYFNLANTLRARGQLHEAITCYRTFLELEPMNADAHYNLGNMLRDNGQLDEAIACYQNTVKLDPNIAEAHCNLGHVLASQGRFAESLAALRLGHEVGAKQAGWSYPSADWVRDAEVQAGLEVKLGEWLKGEFTPGDTQERLGLASVCRAKKFHHAAAGLYAAAMAADLKLADELKAGHRYNAACHAALAAAGQGNDVAQLDDAERTRLRKQALDWLRADLALWTRQLESDNPGDRAVVQQAVGHWQQDPDLAGIRDAAALAGLPEEEQKACARLWVDVTALLKGAEEKSN